MNDTIPWPAMDDHNEEVAEALSKDNDALRKIIGAQRQEISTLKKELRKSRRQFSKFATQVKRDNAVMNYNIAQRAGIACEIDLKKNEVIYL